MPNPVETQASPYFQKDPLATRSFSVTWEHSELITEQGLTLSSVSVTAITSGITVGATAVVSPVASALISSGTNGTSYEIAYAGTFSDGQIDVQRIIVQVEKIPTGLT